MDAAFWHARWEANQIGFHEEVFHVYLQKFWSHLSLKEKKRVFVPLCGKSLDMLWLLEQEHEVLGVEISPIAVRDFFQENQLPVKVSEGDKFQVWQCDEVTLLLGNFFDLTSTDLQGVQTVYDRASLIALPPEMRRAYARHLSQLLPAKTPILLVTLEYPQEEMNGPPFSVTEQEIRQLFEENFSVDVLETQEVLDNEPHFRKKGLSSLKENAYFLKKK